jgi:hypothetical protein
MVVSSLILAVDALAPPGRLLEQRQRLAIAALRVAKRPEVVRRIDVERVAFPNSVRTSVSVR